MSTRILRSGLVGAALTAGSLLIAGTAGAATTGASGASGATGSTGSTGFQKYQANLEKQLANRAARLSNLASDIAGSKTLSPSHASVLGGRISTEQGNITMLQGEVPNATTWTELHGYNKSMLQDNRVYAVMTPQVFVTIEGDATIAQATTLQGEQSTLQNEVLSLAGQPGYTNAANHYTNFVKRLSGVVFNVTNAEVNALNQMPADYPGDTHVFVNANHTVLNANVSLAYASYDASVIALATGGYSGS